MGTCEVCGNLAECYDVPSYALDMDVDENDCLQKCGMGYPTMGLPCIRPKGHKDAVSDCFAVKDGQGVYMQQDGKDWVGGDRTKWPDDAIIDGEFLRNPTKCASCKGTGRVEDPQHGQAMNCESCSGTGTNREKCGVTGCKRDAIKGRTICTYHAYPAARKPEPTDRRAAIEATRKKLAQREGKEG